MHHCLRTCLGNWYRSKCHSRTSPGDATRAVATHDRDKLACSIYARLDGHVVCGLSNGGNPGRAIPRRVVRHRFILRGASQAEERRRASRTRATARCFLTQSARRVVGNRFQRVPFETIVYEDEGGILITQFEPSNLGFSSTRPCWRTFNH